MASVIQGQGQAGSSIVSRRITSRLTVCHAPAGFLVTRFGLLRIWLVCTVCGACGLRPSIPSTQPLVPFDSPFTILASSVVTAPVEPPTRQFGGISGLAYDAAGDEWIAVSDDHTSPRWFVCRIAVSNGRVEIQNRRLVSARPPPGAAGEPPFLDFEAVIALPAGDLLISSEGATENGRRYPPSLLRFRRDGSYIGEVPLPAKFIPPAGRPGGGLRDNRGFEALALSPDGSHVWAIAEAPLWQDDDLPDAQRTGRSRLLELEIHGDAITTARELVYVVDRVRLPPGLSPGSQVVDQGVSEMAVLADGSVITIERAFVRDAGSRRTVNVIRLFRIRLDGADDVSAIASLRDAPQARPVGKDLLLDLGAMTPTLTPRLARLENFEAMAPGPAVAGGRSLVLMSDDNFNASQVTAAVVLRY
jgi:hypothetical protein